MTTWTRFTFTVVTPMFTGNASTVGAPAIRGVLRYWFRAVAAGHGVRDLRELWQQEEETFGSTRRPSRVALRLNRRPRSTGKGTTPPWMEPPRNAALPGAQYLAGPGLWNRKEELLCNYAAPGSNLVLEVRFSGSDRIDSRFLYTLWAWVTFGGLGARTRRGWGQLRLDKVEPDTDHRLQIWDEDYLSRPRSVADWTALIQHPALPDTDGYNYHEWGSLPDPPPVDGAPPEWPTLAPPWWGGRMLTGTHRDLGSALQAAGTAWRGFQVTARPAPGQSTPEWSAAIVGADTRFPRGALGLPVGYYRPARTPADTAFSSTVHADGGSLRRASPVWLRPVELVDGWHVFTHAFRSRLLPAGTQITAGGDAHEKVLTIPVGTLDAAVSAWLNEQRQRRLPPDYYDTPE